MIDIDIQKLLHGSDGMMNLHTQFEIKKADFVALYGQSGSGKTTLLRILAGLENAKGTIKIDGEVWQDGKKFLPVQKRKIGFVFQDYALFENMNVLQNLLFVNKDTNLARKLLRMTQLEALQDRFPSTLSGGQKQRVSLCRAMMNRPKLLLMDEPLSALDTQMRLKLQQEIHRLHKEFGTTTLMVSHDPSEIYKLTSSIIHLHMGKIIAQGTPKEILRKSSGSQKFSFDAEVIDIIKVDVMYIAVIAIGQQLAEVVLCTNEAKNLQIGQTIKIGTKAFAPTIGAVA